MTQSVSTTQAPKVIRLSDQLTKRLQPVFRDRSYLYKIVSSGRAGTKSSEAAIEAIYRIISDKPGSVVMLRKYGNKLRSTVYREAKRAISRLGLPVRKFKITTSPMQITCKATGNTIYFCGSDNSDATKGIIDKDGRPICFVVIDEVSDFFLHGNAGADEIVNIEATFVRGNDNDFQILCCYNPPKNPNAGVNLWTKEMEKRPDVLHVHTTYLDVPAAWLGKRLIASAEALKQTDRRQYDWLWLGIPTGIDDLIYYMFDPKRHVREPLLRSYPMIYIGIDYGQMNATTFQAFGLNIITHTLDGLDEYYHSGRDGRQRSPSDYAADLAAFIKQLCKKYAAAVFQVYIDPSAKGLAEEAKRVTRGIGPQVLVRNAQNDVRLGIGRVSDLLTYSRISFAPSQTHAQQEIVSYEYDPKSVEHGDEKPLKTNDHAMDAIRYAVMGAWIQIKPYIPQGAQSYEKEAA